MFIILQIIWLAMQNTIYTTDFSFPWKSSIIITRNTFGRFAHTRHRSENRFFLLHFLICQIATHITSQPVRWFYFPFSVLSNFHRELRWANSKALAYLLHTAIDSSPGTASKVPALPHRSHTVVHRRCCVIFIMFFTVLVRQWNVIYRSLYLAVIP